MYKTNCKCIELLNTRNLEQLGTYNIIYSVYAGRSLVFSQPLGTILLGIIFLNNHICPYNDTTMSFLIFGLNIDGTLGTRAIIPLVTLLYYIKM